MISLVDQIIKILSILIAVVVLSKSNTEGLLVKSLATGAVYAILTFIVFSILNGGFNIGLAIFTDIIFSALVGGVASMLINIVRKK